MNFKTHTWLFRRASLLNAGSIFTKGNTCSIQKGNNYNTFIMEKNTFSFIGQSQIFKITGLTNVSTIRPDFI